MNDFDPNATSLIHIEQSTQRYSRARDHLGSVVKDLQDEITKLRNQYMPRIRTAVRKAKELESELHGSLDANPGLFKKPRTHTFHGIEVGYRKGAGGIDVADEERTVELIEKLFPKSKADTLIKTTKKPIKKALANLDGSELKKIGCAIVDSGDVIVIKPVDGEVEKVVAALLEDAPEEPANH